MNLMAWRFSLFMALKPCIYQQEGPRPHHYILACQQSTASSHSLIDKFGMQM